MNVLMHAKFGLISEGVGYWSPRKFHSQSNLHGYILIEVKFGVEEYIMGPPLRAEFGPER